MTEENLTEVLTEATEAPTETVAAPAESEQPATPQEHNNEPDPTATIENEAETVKAEITLEGLTHAFIFLLGVVQGLPISAEQAEKINFYKKALAV